MLSDKKLAKIKRELGSEFMQELENHSDLDSVVSQAMGAIKSAQDELEANPKYQELKAAMSDVSASLKDVKKRQNAIIDYSLHLIEEKQQ